MGFNSGFKGLRTYLRHVPVQAYLVQGAQYAIKKKHLPKTSCYFQGSTVRSRPRFWCQLCTKRSSLCSL